MNNEFELPTEGVKIYSPDQGWQSAGKPPRTDGVRPGEQSDVEDVDLKDATEDAELEQLEDDLVEQSEAVLLAEDPAIVVEEVTDDAPRYEDLARLREHRTIDNNPLPPALAQDQARSQAAQSEAAALAQVGDSLNSLFLALQQSSPGGELTTRGPNWRDVADISRHMEECLHERQAIIAKLAKVERQIRETRDDLLHTLKVLADMEQQNLEAATVRANISALAANVITKRFGGS